MNQKCIKKDVEENGLEKENRRIGMMNGL